MWFQAAYNLGGGKEWVLVPAGCLLVLEGEEV